MLVEINGREIGEGQPVFVVAEIGINHNGCLESAKLLVSMAKMAGADAVKLQTYITEKRIPKSSPIFNILKQCELSFAEQKELFEYARDEDIMIFSTPFDNKSIDFLDLMDVPCYKVASIDIANREFLQRIAEKGKPVIMSRGMANRQEIDIAVNEFKDIILLHCISAYPTPHTSLHLDTIQALRERYSCPVGFSDHTLGTKIAPYAVAVGANVIEKHLTLSRRAEGPDHFLSVEPDEMRDMIREIRYISEAMGEAIWSAIPAEKETLKYRRIS